MRNPRSWGNYHGAIESPFQTGLAGLSATMATLPPPCHQPRGQCEVPVSPRQRFAESAIASLLRDFAWYSSAL